MRQGLYEFMGNTIEYEGGNTGYDLDSREDVPTELIASMGQYLRPLDDEE